MADDCERWKLRDPGEIIERLLAESGAAERRAQALIAKVAAPQGMVPRGTIGPARREANAREVQAHAPRDRYYTQACQLRIRKLMGGSS
jgi:hypothetical protein